MLVFCSTQGPATERPVPRAGGGDGRGGAPAPRSDIRNAPVPARLNSTSTVSSPRAMSVGSSEGPGDRPALARQAAEQTGVDLRPVEVGGVHRVALDAGVVVGLVGRRADLGHEHVGGRIHGGTHHVLAALLHEPDVVGVLDAHPGGGQLALADLGHGEAGRRPGRADDRADEDHRQRQQVLALGRLRRGRRQDRGGARRRGW